MNYSKSVPLFKQFLSFLAIALLMAPGTNAQPSKVSRAQRPAYFVYAEAAGADQDAKVLFVSRHIICMNNSSLPYIERDLHLDFGKRVDRIQHESQNAGDSKNITIRTVGLQEIYGPASAWARTGKYDSSVTTAANTVKAMEKIRENFIRDYQSRGYTVYQIDFTPNLAGGSNYSYLHPDKGYYVNWKLERVSPLTTQWIPYYPAGDVSGTL